MGDVCQCGDATGDGIVKFDANPTLDDYEQLYDMLAGVIVAPGVIADIEKRCSVAGTPECNIRDLVVLAQALDAAAPVKSFCDAALSPAPTP